MDAKQLSLSKAIEGYFLHAHARRLSPHTLRDYDHTFRRFETLLGRDPSLRHLGSIAACGPSGSAVRPPPPETPA